MVPCYVSPRKLIQTLCLLAINISILSILFSGLKYSKREVKRDIQECIEIEIDIDREQAESSAVGIEAGGI